MASTLLISAAMCRVVLVAAATCFQVGSAADQDTFRRPNLNECASPASPVNFMEYATTLGDVVQCNGPVCDYQVCSAAIEVAG